MKFLQRFKFYAFGLLIGSMLVYFTVVRHRDEMPAWTPNDRVLQELRLADTILMGADVVLPFPDSLLKGRIRQSTVRFGESDVRTDSCRVYQLVSDRERMRFRICAKAVSLVEYNGKE